MFLPSINETAYPRLKNVINKNELANIYTPTEAEIDFANKSARKDMPKLCLLVMLKTFQRLGYFIQIKDVPLQIIEHIMNSANITIYNIQIDNYDGSNTKSNHIVAIRNYLNIKAYNTDAKQLILKSVASIAKFKDEPADLINVAIEELVKNRYELPAFNTLVRIIEKVIHDTYELYYKHVHDNLDENNINLINKLFQENEGVFNTPWNVLKKDAGKPSINNIKNLIIALENIKSFEIKSDILSTIPDVKLKNFVCEAQALDASKMKELKPHKRYTLAIAFLMQKYSSTLDDIGEMFIKIVKSSQKKAQDKKEEHRIKHSETTNDLVSTLKALLIAYKTDGSKEEKFNAIESIIQNTEPDDIIDKCETHNTLYEKNYYSFSWESIKGKRSILFKILSTIDIYSTTQDKTIELLIKIIQKYKNSNKLEQIPKDEFENIDLSWISEQWTKLLTGHTGKIINNEAINRRHLEVCIFYEIMNGLKSGDLYIKDSDNYSDYREQLISWEEYDEQIRIYEEQIGLPILGDAFINHIKILLDDEAHKADKSFLDNQYLQIKNGEPILARIKKKDEPKNLNLIKSLLIERLKNVNVLDILSDTEKWLNWTKYFGPLSGFDSKIDNPIERYLITTFCYGCNLGPSQTSNSLDMVSRKQVSWINQWHLNEDKLDQSINHITNLYNRFNIIKFWGTGERAAADGTKWDLYEQNLLSEYHIRYGGYGGIGYYHVSDRYIALFSRFIPCGVWEGVNILDILMNEDLNIKPNTLHADTQGQNEPIFGLSFLLGIDLMPRIRNWKNLKLYKSDKQKVYEHIEELFSDSIDWELIKIHLPDMLRVVLSIKMGRITPSTILKKLGSCSRKNKLHQAFRELGRVIRTIFLLKYISDVELRSTIQASTNKCEAFNGFIKWLFFGGEGIISKNNRQEQRKTIKYNHIIANCVIFYNVYHMSLILQNLISEGYEVNEDILSSMSPYITSHINRFGKYTIDSTRKTPDLNFDIKLA